MREYKKKYQAEYMSTDEKPKGRSKKAIEGSNRMRAKQRMKKLPGDLIAFKDECIGTRNCICYWCLFYTDGD